MAAEEKGAEMLCSLCRKRPAAVHSETGAFSLCEQCGFLLYPQMNPMQARQQALSIEAAVGETRPANPCSVCSTREAQFFREDGNFCIVCAKRAGFPEADKTARRMGISAEELAEFAEAAAPEVPVSAAAQSDARFEVTERCMLEGQTLLVIRDRKTGMHYLTNGQLSAFTPLPDGGGQPVIG